MDMEQDKRDILKNALVQVLAPLARLLMQHGIGFREFGDLMKQAYFQAGQELLRADGQKENLSRLAVLTGLHRKDLAAFTTENDSSVDIKRPRSVGAALIATWITNPDYLDPKGQPLPLTYQSVDPKEKSFTKLVADISKDVRPRPHLDDLLRLGLVDETDGMITLKSEAFVPSNDFTAKLGYFERQLHDHLSAAAANLTNSPPPFFDRSAHHKGLSAEDINALRAIVDHDGMGLLKKIYAEAESRIVTNKDGQTDHHQGKHRMSLGIYMYHTPEDEQE